MLIMALVMKNLFYIRIPLPDAFWGNKWVVRGMCIIMGLYS